MTVEWVIDCTEVADQTLTKGWVNVSVLMADGGLTKGWNMKCVG